MEIELLYEAKTNKDYVILEEGCECKFGLVLKDTRKNKVLTWKSLSIYEHWRSAKKE